MAPCRGTIFLDGVATCTVPLERLRSSIGVIPQDPVLFSWSVRRNLDPFGHFSDEALRAALKDVQLWPVVELMGGLDASVTESGGNFSVGQRQLLCLARAILRNNKVLVMDEATANVDHATDSLIQRTLRERFAAATVLTIAHRIHTVADSDRVLVMDHGQVAEFAPPAELLAAKPPGLYATLVQHAKAARA
jgi:ATP-binding cassette subfamily C (CFTR/MRP) protein 4